jgi:hypothetical protein
MTTLGIYLSKKSIDKVDMFREIAICKFRLSELNVKETVILKGVYLITLAITSLLEEALNDFFCHFILIRTK